MKENPYNKMLGIMNGIAQNNQNQTASVGKVVVPPPEIQVSYNGIILDKDDVFINENLLKGYYRTAKGHIVSATQNRAGGGGYAEFASHNHDIDNDYTDTIIYTDTLKVGDWVSVHPVVKTDEQGTKQMYLIESKLVYLNGNEGKYE